MKTTKHISLSICCNYRISVAVASFGDPNFYFCEKCGNECDKSYVKIQTHEEVGKGHYRKIDNSKIGY